MCIYNISLSELAVFLQKFLSYNKLFPETGRFASNLPSCSPTGFSLTINISLTQLSLNQVILYVYSFMLYVCAGLGKAEALLRNQSIKETATQAESMLVAHKQAKGGQEKAVVHQAGNESLSTRELNPSFKGLERSSNAQSQGKSRAFKDLIMSSSAQLAERLPKVALMFLTRGEMPLEKTWRVFLESIPLQGAFFSSFSFPCLTSSFLLSAYTSGLNTASNKVTRACQRGPYVFLSPIKVQSFM